MNDTGVIVQVCTQYIHRAANVAHGTQPTSTTRRKPSAFGCVGCVPLVFFESHLGGEKSVHPLTHIGIIG